MSNPTRTILVVLSIFIGVFSVGLITGTQSIVVREMNAVYQGANPANATISVSTAGGFRDTLVETIEDMDEVGSAEGRRRFSARVRAPLGDWQNITFVAIDDFDDVAIDRFSPLAGAWPPRDKQVLIERSGLTELDVQLGDVMLVEHIDGSRQRRIEIVGSVIAPTEPPAQFGGILGYVDEETMDWLSGSNDGYDQLLITSAERQDDIEHNREVAQEVYEKLQKSDLEPSFPNVSNGEHPLNTFIGAMVAILGGMAVMSVFLSGFLVTNTIAALLAQQTRQIGIMKAVGARTQQIIGLYMVLVLSFGVITFVLAMPLGQLATSFFADLIAGFFNLTLTSTRVLSRCFWCKPLSA
ncbi:MAG: ABC transporter permease [Blastochloris sp.]|nr:ABC transporter permease [Blastochloris sp.]